jgi:hypothetical protein
VGERLGIGLGLGVAARREQGDWAALLLRR